MMPNETSSAAENIKSSRPSNSSNPSALASANANRPNIPPVNLDHARFSNPGGQLSGSGGSLNLISNHHSRSLSNPVNKTSFEAPKFPALKPPMSAGLPNGSSPVAPTSGFANVPQIQAPFTPPRPGLSRGLSLQLPTQNQPLPPYLDPALGFSTVRRPRLDFTRSCTSLHHSFVADSPDSSPLTPSMPIPRRGLDSPIAMYNGGAGSILSSMLADSHVASDDSSSDDTSDDDEMELSSAHSQFGPSLGGSSDFLGSSGLLNRRHMTRLRGKGRSRQSSSSASASSTSLASPSPTTPPNGEVKKGAATGGYFGTQLSDVLAQRRQSISQAMKKIGFTGSDDGKSQEGGIGKQSDAIRRPVTRRGNLLPKPKHFQRVKAALIEESTPVDAEMRIEAAIQRQLREDDEEEDSRTVPQTPVLQAQTEDDQPLVFEDTEDESNGISFKSAAQRNSGYWGTLESSSPGGFMGFRMNPDGDIIMGTDSMVNSPISRSPEVRKLKRRRDDDDVQFEPPSIIKRRAVSPGFSQSPTVSSSPVAIPANSNPGSGGTGTTGGGTSGTRSKRSSYIQDAHDGMSKMSISPFI